MTEVRVLGPVEVSTDRGRAELAAREAAVVAALALGERPMTAAELVQLIWVDPPATAVGAVRNHMSRLRHGVDSLVSVGNGYRFDADVQVDARRLEAVAAGAVAGELDGDAEAQIATLGVVRDSWRADPFEELVARPRVLAARGHLHELRAIVEEERAAAMLDAGQPGRAHALLERLVRDAPRRSRRWSLLALACYRLGLRDAALAASTRANDFRTDADPVVDHQVVAILRDDPALLTVPARPVTRRAEPIIGRPVDPALRRFTFVGRVPELERLRRAFDDGSAGRAPSPPPVVVIEGDPGIGKTLLAYHAATEAAGRDVLALWGWCDPTPMAAFPVASRLLQDLVAALGTDAIAELAGDDLGVVVDIVPDADWSPAHRRVAAEAGAPAGEVGVRVLTAAAHRRPLVCVVDDVHWAPPSTVRLLAELAGSGAPIVLVLLARAGRVPPGLESVVTTRLALGALEPDDVDDFLDDAFGFAPDPELVRLMWSRTGGHPLLLREVVESIEPGASPAEVHALASSPELPRSIADAVERRLQELGPAALRAVQAASVLGLSFSPPLLNDMIDLEDDALAEATAAGILAPEARRGRTRFCHELVREAVYDALPARRRAQLHEAAGVALTNRHVPRWDEVAHHFTAAADLDPRRAAAACRRAGEEERAAFAYDDAAEHHHREVELLEQSGAEPEVLVDALIDRGYSMLRCGDDDVVGVLLRAATIAREAGDGARLARAVTVLCDLGPTSGAGAPDPVLLQLVDDALDGAGDPDTTARLAASASSLFSLSDWERCRSLYERAVSCGASTRAMADVLPFASLALGGPDDLGRRGAAADALDVIADEDRDPVAGSEALHVRIGVQLQLGDPAFRETLERMVEMESVVSEPSSRWSIAYLTATREHIGGDLEAAEAAAAESLGPVAHGIAESRLLAAYGAQVVALRADEGRLAELVPMLEDLVADQPGVAAWRAVLVGALAADRESTRAKVEFDRLAADGFAALPRDFTWTAAMTVLTAGIASVGDAERSRQAHATLAPYSGRMSWSGSCTLGPVDQALGEAAATFGDLDGARAHFRRAAEIAERLGAPRMLARARSALGARLPARDADGIVD